MRTIISDGAAEDLIRSIVQLICAEGHLKTLIEKYNAQLENGLIDLDKELEAHTEKLEDTIQELNLVSELRRSSMLRLFEMYEGDKDWHCMVKHLGAASYNLFEAYQASEEDPDLYIQWLEANKRFVHAMTRYLGVEITECASCFADMLKGERNV